VLPSEMVNGHHPDHHPRYSRCCARAVYEKHGIGKPSRKIVVFSGSSHFIDVMAVCAWEEEKRGHVTMHCNLLPNWYTDVSHHLAEEQGVAPVLDAVHLSKIDLADELFVVNVGNYIGESTQAEIEYATRRGIPIRYYMDEKPDWHLCVRRKGLPLPTPPYVDGR